MLIALEFCWRMLLLKNMSLVALSVTYGVGGLAWPISVSDTHIDAPLRQFTKRAHSSASIFIARMLLIVMDLT